MFSIFDYRQMEEVLPGLKLFFHNELYMHGNTFTLLRKISAA